MEWNIFASSRAQTPTAALSQPEPIEKELLKNLKKTRDTDTRQQILRELYRFYKKKELYYQAITYALQLQDILKNQKDEYGLEGLLLDLGEIYFSGRDYLNALHSLFEALAYSKQLKVNHSGMIYYRMAEIFRIMNRPELAWKYIKKTLDFSIYRKDLNLKVRVLSFYSHLYYEAGDYTQALHYVDLSMKTEKLQKKDLCTIPNLYLKAQILKKIARKEAMQLPVVLGLLKAAVSLGLKNRQYDDLLPVLAEYLETLIARGLFTEAARYLNKMDTIYAPHEPYYFVCDYVRALYYHHQHERQTALTYYQKAAQKLELFFYSLTTQPVNTFKDISGRIYGALMEFYLEQFNREKKQLYLEKALYYSEIKNSYICELDKTDTKYHSSLTPALTQFHLEKKKITAEFSRIYQKYIRLLRVTKTTATVPSTGQGWSSVQELNKELLNMYEKKLASLKQQEEALMEFILETPKRFKRYTFKQLNLRRLQAKLKPWQHIIKYAVLEHHMYAFCIDAQQVTYHRLAGTTDEMRELLQRLVEPLKDLTNGQVDYLRVNFDLQAAAQLYQLLLLPVLPPTTLNNNEELFIIPDQQLFQLPFEALVTGFKPTSLDVNTIFSEYASADYVIQRYAISYGLSCFHLLNSKGLSRPKPYLITACGAPVITDETNSQLQPGQWLTPLPSAEKELKTIQTIFGKNKSKLFMGDLFTQRLFETYAPQSEILHIATHFINNIEHPYYSALVFSMCNNGFPFYYAHYLSGLNLDLDLVVLSACESSETHLSGMQGLRGITASFRFAGARALLVSMWPVDEQSAQLTPVFYRFYLADSAKHPAHALRQAKLLFMKKTTTLENGIKISLAHPFLWANYILYSFVLDQATGQ